MVTIASKEKLTTSMAKTLSCATPRFACSVMLSRCQSGNA